MPELIVTPTVNHELAHLMVEGDIEEEKELAQKALTSLLDWGFSPLNLAPVGHGIVEQIGDRMRTQQLLPFEERNDSFIIAEAALCHCPVLITSDRALLDIDRGELADLLKRHDVEPVAILSPQQVVRVFGGGR